MTVQELINQLSELSLHQRKTYLVETEGCDCVDYAGDVSVEDSAQCVTILRERG